MTQSQSYYENYGELNVSDYVNKYILSSTEEMNRINTIVDSVPDDVETVVDIGAGHGIFLKKLEERKGIRGVGIEITDTKIQYANSIGVDMRKGSAAELEFADNSFDLLVASEVIEHLPYKTYEAALYEFSRVTRKYIIITVPFDEKRIFIKCPYCGSSSNPSCHFRSFSLDALNNLFEDLNLIKSQAIGTVYRRPLAKFKNSFLPDTWPQLSICPACGFRHEDSYLVEEALASKEKGALRESIRKVANVFSKKESRWMLGLYTTAAH